MQKGLAASPSWPLGTKGYVVYKGKKAEFFIGDRGPGVPSGNGIMLDLDGKTFAELTGGTWNTRSLTVEDAGGLGHIPVEYVVTEWGPGPGKKGAPKPFSTGAYRVRDQADPPPPCPTQPPAPGFTAEESGPSETSAPGAADAVDASPIAQAWAAAAGMAPFRKTAATEAESLPTRAEEAPAATAPSADPSADLSTHASAGASVGSATATSSPALTPASATEGPSGEVAAPAFAAAIVVIALVAVGAKAMLRRSAHGATGDAARHTGRQGR